jgi:hypothetical protein
MLEKVVDCVAVSVAARAFSLRVAVENRPAIVVVPLGGCCLAFAKPTAGIIIRCAA